MFELYEGALNPALIYARWFEALAKKNCGALLSFCGIVREENQIQGLSFDINEKLLKTWFDKRSNQALKQGFVLCLAHSMGDVKVHESSYFTAVLSKQRKEGLALLCDFVEDFKANAPIWKYDIINGEKIYALKRSQKLSGAGILS